MGSRKFILILSKRVVKIYQDILVDPITTSGSFDFNPSFKLECYRPRKNGAMDKNYFLPMATEVMLRYTRTQLADNSVYIYPYKCETLELFSK